MKLPKYCPNCRSVRIHRIEWLGTKRADGFKCDRCGFVNGKEIEK